MRWILTLICTFLLAGPGLAAPERIVAHDDWAVFVDRGPGDDLVCWAVTRQLPAQPGGALGQVSGADAMLYLTVWPGPRGWVELSVQTDRRQSDWRKSRLFWQGPDLIEEVTLLGRDTLLWLARDKQGQGTAILLGRWSALPDTTLLWLTGTDAAGRGFEMQFSLQGALRAVRTAQGLCAAPIS